jgi:hypothetical protein
MGYFGAWYLGDIARLPFLDESYFRNNADLGTGLLIANFAITSPHFFGVCPWDLPCPRLPDFLQQRLEILHPSSYGYPIFGSGFLSGFLEKPRQLQRTRYSVDETSHPEI